MFEIRNFHKNVYVDGSIILDTDKEVSYVSLVSLTDLTKDQCDEVITPDNILIENGKTIHYVDNDTVCEDNAVYHAKRGVSSCFINIKRKNNPYACVYAYYNKLSEPYPRL